MVKELKISCSSRPSQATCVWSHSNLSLFSFSLTPSFTYIKNKQKINIIIYIFLIFYKLFKNQYFQSITWIQNSSALANASWRYCLSGWSIGVCCKI